MFNICEFSKVTIISAGSNAENKKPLTRLQKEKSTANDEDNWELVPPDGGWVRKYSLKLICQVDDFLFLNYNVDSLRL